METFIPEGEVRDVVPKKEEEEVLDKTKSLVKKEVTERDVPFESIPLQPMGPDLPLPKEPTVRLPGETEKVVKMPGIEDEYKARGRRVSRISRAEPGMIIAAPGARDEDRPVMIRRKSRATVGARAEPDKPKVPFLQTTELAKYGTQKEYLLVSLRDFLLYLLWAIVIALIASDAITPAHHYYANVVTGMVTKGLFRTQNNLLKTFYDIRILDQIWNFINDTLLSITYNPSEISRRTFLETKGEKLIAFYETVYFGMPRVRQVRVRNDSCKVPEGFKYIFDTCYYFFSPASEDKEPFGLGKGTIWTYQPAEETKAASVVGEISTYTGGGYYMDFSEKEETTRQYLSDMWNYTWIDHGTRAILLDFVTYSKEANLFCVAKLLFEIPPSGGVITTSNIRIQKLLRYTHAHDYYILGLEIGFLVIFCYYIFEEGWELVQLRLKYFANPWNYFDMSVLILALATLVVAYIRHSVIARALPQAYSQINSGSHINFDEMASIHSTFMVLLGVLALIVWLKLFKYAHIVRPGAVVLNAFEKVKMELLALTLMLLLLVFGFAMFAHVIFGTHVEEFNTISNSMFTLIALISGGLYFYKKCEEARPVLAPIFFILYIFVVILLFLNWFAAVIVHGLLRASKDFDDADDMYEHVFLIELVRYTLKRMFLWCKCRRCYTKLDNYDRKLVNRTDFDIIEALLKRNGFSRLERELFFRRHKIPREPNIVITQAKMDNVVADINGMNKLYAEVDDHEQIMEEVEKTKRKLEILEHALSDMVVKVDVLLDKIKFEDSKKK